MILLDTNVLSELMKLEPSPNVLGWLVDQPDSSLFTTAITQAEIFYGAHSLPHGVRKDDLLRSVEEMFERDFRGRVLPFDGSAARFFAHIAADRRSRGRPISQFDAQIAAIARSRGSALATRNIEDFAECGIEVFNPWESSV